MTNEFALAQLRHLYVQMASDGNNISNQSAARGLLAPVIAHLEASMTPYAPLPAAPSLGDPLAEAKRRRDHWKFLAIDALVKADRQVRRIAKLEAALHQAQAEKEDGK